MSGNTNQRGHSIILLAVCISLISIGIFSGYLSAGMEITGTHTFGPYHIEPFSEPPAGLDEGLGRSTPIIRFQIYATGISSQHVRQSAALSLFWAAAETPFREPVRFFIPVLFSLLTAGFILLRFAPRAKTASPVPQKILACVSAQPGISLKEIVLKTGASRGSVSYHLNNLIRERKMYSYKLFGHARPRYSTYDAPVPQADVPLPPTAEKILAYISRNPDVSRQQMASALDISASVVYWHLSRLEQMRLVRRRKSGRHFVYACTEERGN